MAGMCSTSAGDIAQLPQPCLSSRFERSSCDAAHEHRKCSSSMSKRQLCKNWTSAPLTCSLHCPPGKHQHQSPTGLMKGHLAGMASRLKFHCRHVSIGIATTGQLQQHLLSQTEEQVPRHRDVLCTRSTFQTAHDLESLTTSWQSTWREQRWTFPDSTLSLLRWKRI